MKINERGFWENETAEGHGHDEGLAHGLVDFFKENDTKTILDIGCGTGYYTNFLADKGFVTNGIDGNPNTVKLAGPRCFVADISKPIKLLPADWVLCLEVGEHIPQEYEKVFLDNLDKHNTEGMVISWAVRGQGGDGHVNCKDNEEIIPTICSMGYDFEVPQTHALRQRCAVYPNIGWWFRNTLMIFRRKK